MNENTKTPPESIILQASELAYELEADMVVGMNQEGQWVIREWEDPQEINLKNRVVIDAAGVKD